MPNGKKILSFFYRELKEGEVIPWWMGSAFLDYERYLCVCCILPLNWPVRAFRHVHFFFKRNRKGWLEKRDQRIAQAAYEQALEYVGAQEINAGDKKAEVYIMRLRPRDEMVPN